MGILDIFSKSNENKQEEIRSYNTFIQGRAIPIFEEVSDKNRYLENIPSLKKGSDIIVSMVSNLPIKLIKEDGNKIKQIKNDYRLSILNNEVNAIETSMEFKSKVIKDLIFDGKSYAKIEKKGNKILGLHHVKEQSTKLYLDKNGYPLHREIAYVLHNKNYTSSEEDMLIVSNPNNGILNTNRSLLNNILEEYSAYQTLTENAASPLAILKTEGRLNPDALQKLKNAWGSLYTGRKNAGKTVILENGLDYQPISNDISKFNMEEKEKVICEKVEKILNLPNGYLSSSNSYDDLNFLLTETLLPIISCFENALNKSLLLETEKENGYNFVIDTMEMFKVDDSKYQENVLELFNNGVITLMETRAMLNLTTNEIARDLKILGLGNILQYQDNGEVFVPNTGMVLGNKPNNQGYVSVDSTKVEQTNNITTNDKKKENIIDNNANVENDDSNFARKNKQHNKPKNKSRTKG